MAAAKRKTIPAGLTRQRLTVPPPPAPFIRETTRISALAELLARVELLRNDILPCCPQIDIGTDLVTQHHNVLKRVQIKGQATNGRSPDTFTFSTRRNDLEGKQVYRPDELDVFIFVHTELIRFFVVPAERLIDSGRYTITFGPNSHMQWENAWWLLKKL